MPPTLRHQRISMSEPTPEEDLLETIDELYGAARSAVLDAARAWRIGGGAPWTVKALVAAIDALASAEALLRRPYRDGEGCQARCSRIPKDVPEAPSNGESAP